MGTPRFRAGPLTDRLVPVWGWLSVLPVFAHNVVEKQSSHQRHDGAHHVVAGQPRIIHERKCQLGHGST
ncbi:hypothetical protein MPL3356_140187 [Mesorhizobium plurifarium]|uniref:Uncharacterized protein n=1 Tax=Mesorhizobium plurifarium TaxID=69974 RepID=A0A090F296_MESPL|nr:hypothetical protein MPL3356_140187 [Mesorhizobium plurifarium]CDX32367.1 hypothetical protein MPLDJ20_150130 [Mesorhizobium plurifarium]CDX56409.1 hypothetical protein MPL3365_230208 [Mesorhizobium plurifarium]